MKKTMKRVAENLYRSSRPHSVKDIPEIDIIVNLQSGTYEFFNDDRYETETERLKELVKLDKTLIRIPCSDFTPPTKDQVLFFLSIVERAKQENKNVLVHCLSGVDRTGFMCAAYRMQKGWSYEEAKQEYIKEGQHWWYRWWIPFLKKVMV